jgi:hypothetical protein
MPALLKLTPEEDFHFARAHAILWLDFTDLEAPPQPWQYVTTTPGWEWMVDSKDKHGLIATVPWSHLAVNLSLGPVSNIGDVSGLRISVGFLATYTNISGVACWFDSDPELNATAKAAPGLCDPTFATDTYTGQNGRRKCAMNGLLHKGISETKIVSIMQSVPQSTSGALYLHLCLLPSSVANPPVKAPALLGSAVASLPPVSGDKFKLLNVIVFPHFEPSKLE